MKQKIKKITSICLTAAVILSTVTSIIGFSLASAEEDNTFSYSKTFDNIDMTTVDGDFVSAFIGSDGTVTGKPSEQWSADTDNKDKNWTFYNTYLKPEKRGGTTLLTLKDTMAENFTAKIEMLDSYTEYGIIFGQSSPTDTDYTSGAVKIRMREHNGSIIAYGVQPGTVAYVGSTVADGFSTGADWAADNVYKFPDIFSTAASGADYTAALYGLNIEVKDGAVKLWWDGYEQYAWTVSLSDKYEGGYISLYSTGYDQGGIKSFSIEGERIDRVYEEIDGTDCDFTTLESMTQLDSDFDAYLVKNGESEGTIGKPGDYWTTSTALENYEYRFQNPWLKPMHRSTGDTTLLTYNKAVYTDVEVKTEFVTNFVRYGIMIAPAGELASADNGIRVYVESNGIINIEGAVDAGGATAAGGQVKVGGKNKVSGFAISGFVAPSNDQQVSRTAYHLNVRILDGNISVWLDEFSDYIISAPLTDSFKGGSVSLYASSYEQGAFKSLKIDELEGSAPEEPENVYYLSFNTLDSLDSGEFEAYLLENAAEQPKEIDVDDAFRLDGGKLVSNLSKGGDEHSGFAALTLTGKRYDNFELTLRYEQDWVRYGVMLGTEPGEFAYKLNGSRLSSDGGVFVYTEAEGYRNIKGALYSTYYTVAQSVLCRMGVGEIPDSFTTFGDPGATINNRPIHTMKIRVVGDYLTMVVDNDESTRVTVRLDNYDGGYISLVTNSAANRGTGAICSVMIEELGEDAELEADLPSENDNFQTLGEVEEMFDAYYLENAEESTELEAVELKEHWYINNGGYLSRNTSANGIQEFSDIELLTYSAREFTDFELTYTYQQSYQRLGIVIGGDGKTYPLTRVNGTTTGTGGSIFYVEAEGYPNLKGDLHNFTLKNDALFRVTKPSPSGFMDANNNASDNVNARKVHTVKIIVKDKMLYAFIDGSEEPYAYVKLGDAYDGGYVSLFSTAADSYGFGSFTISDKITTPIPAAGGAEQNGDEYDADFDSVRFDDSAFTTYYLEAVSGNPGGDMTQHDFDDMWTVANGSLTRSQNLSGGGDTERVSVLTYNKRLTDFVVTYQYQKTAERLMFLFGAEKGKYPLYNSGGPDMENGGVILYPENDLGAGGGLIALGNVARLNASYRPINSKKIVMDGYHIIYPNDETASWTSNFGTWHTMTVAVVSGHCYVWLDDYGMIADYELAEDYDGGYISFAAGGNGYGFDNIKIKDLSSMPGNAVVAVENPHDISVKTGSQIPALPDEVTVILKNGKTATAPVSFTEVYWDGDTEGTYRFTSQLGSSSAYVNPGSVGAVLNVRVKESIPQQSADSRYWSFDTDDDLSEFESSYVISAENGYSDSDLARWFTSNGRLARDEFRTTAGSYANNIAVLTYTGSTYNNFELEVDYTQQYSWMGVMFGSKEIGEYIDLNDPHNPDNPVIAYVEFEGFRNFMGNVRNTNYYNRTDDNVYNARENVDSPEYYYTETGNYLGNTHTLKLRVVGDQAMLWYDDQTEPFTVELTDYDGGYISLFSTAKGAYFDNLKITRLDDSGKPVYETAVAANGTMTLEIDPNASAELVIPDRSNPEEAPETEEMTNVKGETESTGVSPLIIAVIVFDSLIIAAFIIFVTMKILKSRKYRRIK